MWLSVFGCGIDLLSAFIFIKEAKGVVFMPQKSEKYIRERDSASCLINIHGGFWQNNLGYRQVKIPKRGNS